MVVQASIITTDPEGYAQGCLALAQCTTDPSYETITAETLIVAGQEDQMTPLQVNADHIKANIKNSRMIVLENVGHCPHVEDWKRSGEELKNFVGAQSQEPGVLTRLLRYVSRL